MKTLRSLLQYEPVVLGWVLNGGLAVLLGNVVHITSTQEAAVTTIATGLVGVVAWVKTKEHVVSGLVSVLSTVAFAAGSFGLHLSSAQIGAGAAILSGILALLLRQNVTPVAGPLPVKDGTIAAPE